MTVFGRRIDSETVIIAKATRTGMSCGIYHSHVCTFKATVLTQLRVSLGQAGFTGYSDYYSIHSNVP